MAVVLAKGVATAVDGRGRENAHLRGHQMHVCCEVAGLRNATADLCCVCAESAALRGAR